MSIQRASLMYSTSMIVMFIIAYVMVDTWEHIYLSINKFYMAALMVAAMGVVNSFVMPDMYPRNMRWIILSVSVTFLIMFTVFLRYQTFVGDEQFIRAMIPHHSSAILMCEEANLKDQELEVLCQEIIKTQREEISIMQKMLDK